MILATVLICAAFVGLALLFDEWDRLDDPPPPPDDWKAAP